MAAAGPVRDLQDEVTCSICLEYFKDPVMVDCGHNFCRSCITECWEGSDPNCPQCREPSEGRNLRPNRQLVNVVEMVKKLNISTVKPHEGDLCEEHEEKMKLFCEDDQTMICLVCRESRDHKSHTVSPIEEAAQEYKVKLQDWLHPLKKEMEEILKSKLEEEEEYKTLRNKLETERQKIVAEFEALRQLLREQEQTLLRRLEEMDKNITMVENANITKLCPQMTSLSALITEIEEKCKEPAGELLKDVRSTLSRCNNVKFRKPEDEMKKYKECFLEPLSSPHGGAHGDVLGWKERFPGGAPPPRPAYANQPGDLDSDAEGVCVLTSALRVIVMPSCKYWSIEYPQQVEKTFPQWKEHNEASRKKCQVK